MRKILLLLILATGLFAVIGYSVYISTLPTTVYNGSCYVDFFAVSNSSNVAQTVYICDNSTSTVKIEVQVGANSFTAFDIPSGMKFETNVKASCQDSNGNNKVLLMLDVK